MEAQDLLGFSARCEGERVLTEVAASAMRHCHVAYVGRDGGRQVGYLFKHPNFQSFLGSPPTDGIAFQYDATLPSENVIKDLSSSPAFPACEFSCGIFLRKRVYLQTWPGPTDSIFSPLLAFSDLRKELAVKFACVCAGKTRLRKLTFKLKDLDQSLIKVVRRERSLTLYVPLVRNPSTYNSDANENLKYWACNGTRDPWALAAGCLYENADKLWQFLSRLTVIRLEFSLEYRMNSRLESFLRSLGALSTKPPFSIRDETTLNIHPTLTFADLQRSRLSFQLKFLLLCLLSNGYTSCFHLSATFLHRLHRLPEDQCEYALEQVYKSQRNFCAKPQKFEASFSRFLEAFRGGVSVMHRAQKEDRSKESHMLYRVLVTPSTLYFTPPSRELSNRVTRQYCAHLDRFLRMSFVDERLSGLSGFSPSVEIRIEREFLPIFRLFDREYELLSFSSSQLRAGSLWLFANLPDLNVRHIRDWLGDFSRIKNPAKYSARVGQCFSNSKQTIDLEASELTRIEEVKVVTGGKEYTMSDGAGTISHELLSAAIAAAEIPNWKIEFGCSIQIRMGGIKGVVSLDPSLSGRQLCYRESMLKFPSNHRGLEVLNFAQFRYGYLNRQIILLLSSLGIEDSAFLKINDEYLDQAKKVFTDSSVLRRCLAVSDKDEVESPPIMDIVKVMLKQSFSPEADPFLRSIAQALYNRMIMELRQKQRILVKKSACLMGVLDETGTLEYGQTYVHILYRDENDCEVSFWLQSFVSVTKNPCFHPGDVRKLLAVDLPQLRHHVNVVVFPSKGKRPHPNEISGSDLDGDLYFVTWDESLVPTEMAEAMDYSASGKPTTVDEMTSMEMKNFFLSFMKSDNLGIIANAHLALADQSPKKAWDERCLKLARMHSTAVDFAKTGVSDAIPKELKPKQYPDFMENKNKDSYKSEKVIGVLYRKVKDFVFEPSQYRAEDLQEPHPDLRTTAQYLYSLYQEEVQSLMNIFNIESEAELLSGEVAKYSKFYNNNQRKRREEIRTKLKDVVGKLIRALTARFQDLAGSRAVDLAQECRYLAYSGKEALYGFPWVVASSELLREANEVSREL